MLKVEHVTKYYGDFRAVNDISFEIQEGEIFGLLGVNGAGKTTTFRMIMGLLDKNGGKITLDGKEIDYSQTDKIGFLTEERSLLLSKTVLENVLELTINKKYPGFISSDEIGLPMKDSNLVLPCGIYARWEKEKNEE